MPKQRLLFITFVLNGMLFLIGGLDYFEPGKTYLPYAWILSCLVSLMAIVTTSRRNN